MSLFKDVDLVIAAGCTAFATKISIKISSKERRY